ncbi:MAG: DUF1998 domain-containing protein, partial [bacterium]|nr:DUF1998 domain-containing protein [bacterium]
YSHIPEAKKVELQRNLQIAISEFAPGAEIVAAKRIWKSGGIYKRPGRELTKYNYAICPDCNRFYRDMKQLPNTCEVKVCGGKLGRSHTYLVPEFGFMVSSEETKKSGELRPRRMYASEIYFADYVRRTQKGEIRQKPNWNKEDNLSSSVVQVWYRYSRYGLLALVNSGPGKMGFRVCDWCGFAEPAAQFMSGKRPRKPKAHKNPRTGKKCGRESTKTFHLGHDFITDVLEIQFRGSLANNPDSNLWLSTLYALLEGAGDALGIRRDDLSGARYWEKGAPIPSLVLLDRVPGGAGHVHRIAENLVSTFQEAHRRISV